MRDLLLAELSTLAETHPDHGARIRARLRAHEEGRLGFVERAKTIRVDPGLWARAAALQEAISEDPEVRVYVGRMSVAAVCRVALLEGLRVLEQRYLGGTDGQH